METYRGWAILHVEGPGRFPVYVARRPGGGPTDGLINDGLTKLRCLVDLELDGPPTITAHLTTAVAGDGRGLCGWSPETMIYTFPNGDLDRWHDQHHHADRRSHQPRLTHDHEARP